MANEQNLQPGDRIVFDVEGNPKSPFGGGVVTRASNGTYLIQPDYPFFGPVKIINIRKPGTK